VKIEAVDFYYLAMSKVAEEFDGSQDALLVWVQAGDHEGWDECEAAPLVSIARFVCPCSHGACRSLRESVLDQRLDDIADIGRIGDINPAQRVADYAAPRGVTFINHTFTSQLALSASLQAYAGLADHDICEYPVNPKPVAAEMSRNRLAPGKDGLLHLSEAPGLGNDLDYAAMGRYLVDIDITVAGETFYRTPPLPI